MPAPDLKKTIEEQDWEETSRILREYPQLVKNRLSKDEFDILWVDSPLQIIQILLRVWPEAYYWWGNDHRNLIDVKLDAKQWDFLDIIFVEFPRVLTTCEATKAAKYGAPFEFFHKHWKETETMVYFIHGKNWEETVRIFKEYPELAKDKLSWREIGVLWSHAPFEVIQSLLEAWPEAYKQVDAHGQNLVEMKLHAKQWNFSKSIIVEFPSIITAKDVKIACEWDVPIDVFELMLDQQPTAPLEEPSITFRLIEQSKLGHFCAALDRCPAVTELKDEYLQLTPLLHTLQNKEQRIMDWIGPILRANPNAARQTDFDGKTPLHLAYQCGASSVLIDMILQAYPKTENIRDNLGRFPKDLEIKLEKTVFTAANEALILRYNLNAETSFPENAVVVCRGDMLTRDLQAENKEDKDFLRDYSRQVLVRHLIFETLLEKFSKMYGMDDKVVIQQAAAMQCLVVDYLSNKIDTVVDFELFDNPGYWYQQEVLKLVMRSYHEGQSESNDPRPSVLYDANKSMGVLVDMNNGETPPKPNDEHVKAYNDLAKWLTKGLDSDLYSSQGPVLKPIQSSLNKLFIHRGQTSVPVIGDVVRGTLLLDNTAMLYEVVKRIKNTFPNITENRFRHPDTFDKIADFLTYVHDDFSSLPNSDDVIPYYFKANSSQKHKEKPLLYKLNFFLQIPEYHRVGFSEMFVGCELQIGVEEEINKRRQTHVAYERDWILSNQPLLRNYDAMTKEEGKDKFSRMSNCTEDDNKLIEKVLFGKMASEVLIPCTTSAGNDPENNILSFESGPFFLLMDEIKAGSFVKPDRPCLNNRSLNWFALDCPKQDNDEKFNAAFRFAGPYELDRTKRYFVDSFVFKDPYFKNFDGTVGLYARVGPYLIQIACSYVANKTDIETEEIVVVRSGRNFSYLEQACPVPFGTIALEVIAYGKVEDLLAYGEMKVSLMVFDVENR